MKCTSLQIHTLTHRSIGSPKVKQQRDSARHIKHHLEEKQSSQNRKADARRGWTVKDGTQGWMSWMGACAEISANLKSTKAHPKYQFTSIIFLPQKLLLLVKLDWTWNHYLLQLSCLCDCLMQCAAALICKDRFKELQYKLSALHAANPKIDEWKQTN